MISGVLRNPRPSQTSPGLGRVKQKCQPNYRQTTVQISLILILKNTANKRVYTYIRQKLNLINLRYENSNTAASYYMTFFLIARCIQTMTILRQCYLSILFIPIPDQKVSLSNMSPGLYVVYYYDRYTIETYIML